MKLVGCRVKNFKSIKDSGFIALSTDNVSDLIGQNESGKSSFLEALAAFQDSEISDEVVRSDGSTPSVLCTFQTSKEELSGIVGAYGNADKILELASKASWQITYVVEWDDNQQNSSRLEGEIAEAFAKQAEVEAEVAVAASGENDEAETVAESVEAQVEITDTREKLSEETFITELAQGHLPRFELFEDFGSLLPNKIDLADLESENKKTRGYKGAVNFLSIANCDVFELVKKSDRFLDNQVEQLNKQITADFSEFWSQTIGEEESKIEIGFDVKFHREDEPEKIGKAYLSFWVRDKGEKLYPEQRSKGVRWFLSFYLHLKASYRKAGRLNHIFLIDEPGSSLHAKAQEDVLKLIEELKDKVQIIYTTHSPYLLDVKKIYRLTAVQRSKEVGGNSKFLTAHSLGAASTDTLTPLYTIMGIDISHHNTIKNERNVLLEEISIYYYIESFTLLFAESPKDISYLPATGTSNIPQLANLFLGWGLKFSVVLDDDSSGRRVFNSLKKDLFGDHDEIGKKALYKIGVAGVEDLFSSNDFKKFVIGDEQKDLEGKANSEFAKNLSKGILAYTFYQKVQKGDITFEGLTQKTQANITTLMKKIGELVSMQTVVWSR